MFDYLRVNSNGWDVGPCIDAMLNSTPGIDIKRMVCRKRAVVKSLWMPWMERSIEWVVLRRKCDEVGPAFCNSVCLVARKLAFSQCGVNTAGHPVVELENASSSVLARLFDIGCL